MPFALAALILVVVQVLLAVYGHNMIHTYERIMSIILGVLFLVASIIALTRGHGLSAYAPHGTGMLAPFSIGFVAAGVLYLLPGGSRS